MSSPPAAFHPSRSSLGRKGAAAFGMGMSAAAVVGLALTAPSPWWAMMVPAALALLLLAARIRSPLAATGLAVVGTLALAGNTPGITPQEVGFVSIYGLYLLWYYGTRVLALHHLGAPYAGDKAVVLFLVGVVLSIGLTLLHGGDLKEMANSLGAVSVVALYFPIREACVRYPRGLAVMASCVVIVCAGIALGNVLRYRELVQAAVMAEYVAGRRVSVNDFYLGLGFVMSLAFVVRSERRSVILVGIVLVTLFVGALVATQARGQWITCAVSTVVLFVLGRRKGRMRLVTAGACVAVLGAIAVPLLLGGKTTILAGAIARRFTSIGSAASKDLSFISRFVEAEAALSHVWESPVLGHGLGVPFAHFDVITQLVWWTTFVHIGYVGMLYTFGLWGSACLFAIWGGALRRGFSLVRSAPETLEGTVGLGGVAYFAGLIVLMTVSNTFAGADGLFVFGSTAALVAGAHARRHHLQGTPPARRDS